MYLINKFLQTEAYGIYGFGVIMDLLGGHGRWRFRNYSGILSLHFFKSEILIFTIAAWKESANFPVVTYCDLQVSAFTLN